MQNQNIIPLCNNELYHSTKFQIDIPYRLKMTFKPNLQPKFKISLKCHSQTICNIDLKLLQDAIITEDTISWFYLILLDIWTHAT